MRSWLGISWNIASEVAHVARAETEKAKPSRGGLLLRYAVVPDQSKTGDSTPSTLCSFGLVVVYCRNTFFSGKMMGMAPKAASAHS
jgi:hypothetical protein